MSNCTGQPPEWIIVSAASLSPPSSPPARRRRRALLQAPQQQTPILLASQVHADLPQVGGAGRLRMCVPGPLGTFLCRLHFQTVGAERLWQWAAIPWQRAASPWQRCPHPAAVPPPPPPQIPNVVSNMNTSVSNGQLQRQLRGIGLVLVRNSGGWGGVGWGVEGVRRRAQGPALLAPKSAGRARPS